MCCSQKATAWSRVVFGLLICGLLTACSSSLPNANGTAHTLKVVAAENFYADIAQQLGGQVVSVAGILSNPNVDPHEYQANVQTSITVSQADLVIENGAGYDDWMDHILAATPNSHRLVLKGFDQSVRHLPENVHVWYSFENAMTIAQAITVALQKLDPTHVSYFESNLHTFSQSLQPLEQKIAAIKAKYHGTPIGLTETIALYQTEAADLQVLTPFAFEKAIAEGNDPPADTVISATDQINRQQIKLLIYNEQTVTPITTNLENLARTKHIPIVPITELMPSKKTYQTWMMDQLNALQTALGG